MWRGPSFGTRATISHNQPQSGPKGRFDQIWKAHGFVVFLTQSHRHAYCRCLCKPSFTCGKLFKWLRYQRIGSAESYAPSYYGLLVQRR